MRAQHWIAALTAALCASCASLPQPAVPVMLRILAINDWHGHLLPPPGLPGAPPQGGAAHLTTAVKTLSAEFPNAIFVGVGDLIGASPLVSAVQHDEPAMAALGMMGLAFSAVGNHEFDRGRAELDRLLHGGCHPSKGCFMDPWPGSRFPFLAANVRDEKAGRLLLAPSVTRRFGGVSVAFIGAVLQSTPSMVDGSGIVGLRFEDEATAINREVRSLRQSGTEAIVVLLHQGAVPAASADPGDESCPGISGPLMEILPRLDPAIDVVLTGHTHRTYRCRLHGRLVMSAGAYGRQLAVVDLELDPRSADVRTASGRVHAVDAAKHPADPVVAGYVARAVEAARPLAARPVATLARPLNVIPDVSGQSGLGAVVAAAQLSAMRDSQGAQLALMNPGGLRAPITPRGEDGSVTFGDLFAAQPFGNALVAITLTGGELLELLEQQWPSRGGNPRFLQVAGLSYDWDGSAAPGRRIIRSSVLIGGERLRNDRDYRVVVNSFMHSGGDGLSILARGRSPKIGMGDVEALEAFLAGGGASAPFPPSVRRVDLPAPSASTDLAPTPP